MLLHKVVRLLCLWMKSHDVHDVNIQMKGIAQYFPVVPLVVLQTVEVVIYV